MDVEIQTQHVVMKPSWRALIDERVAKLSGRHPRLIRIRVTLRHGRHHLQGAEEVGVLAAVPGRSLRAAKREEDMTAALRAAFDAIERELAEHSTGQRRFGKPPGPRPQGIVTRVFPDRHYGFILVDGGEEVYFHRNALHRLDFDALHVGQPVGLAIEQGQKGRRASRVFPVGERWSA